MTAKGAKSLKEIKEANALKSSGAGHGFFQKRLMGEADPEKKDIAQKPKSRPASAIVSAAVGFMQNLKRNKELKPPKKPDILADYEDMNLPNEQEEEVKPKWQAAKGILKQILEGSRRKKPEKAEEFDDDMFKNNEEEAGTEAVNVAKQRPESAKPVKPLTKKKKEVKKEEDYNNDMYEIENVDGIENTQRTDYQDVDIEDIPEYVDEENFEQEEIEDDDDFDVEREVEEHNEPEVIEESTPKSSVMKRFRSNIANVDNCFSDFIYIQ